jgi:predicted ATP-grasp superfamily ATP-dependent carboligase
MGSRLRILTTNGAQEAGYSTVRCLRPLADRVVLGWYGDRPTDVGLSRFVDARYPLELPKTMPRDALTGRRQADERERRWVQSLLETCRRESLSTFVPTTDNEVHVTARHAGEFEAAGVYAPVAPARAVRAMMDKFEVTRTAAAAGVPVPRSVLPADARQARSFAGEVGFPLVAKARTGFFSQGVRVVRAARELDGIHQALGHDGEWPVLQEYVPGGCEPSVLLACSPTSEPRAVMTLRKLRYAHPSFSSAVRTAAPLPEVENVLELARTNGLVGIAAFQFKLDPRDGRHKLMEINPRLGANSRIVTRLALRAGVNLVWLTLPESAEEPAPATFPAGLDGVSPFEDVMAVVSYLRIRRRKPSDPINPPPSARDFARSYWSSYVRRRATSDWFASALLEDPRCALGSFARNGRDIWRARAESVPWGDLLAPGGT